MDDKAVNASAYTLYFDIVDTAGHNFGPNSPELTVSVAKVDQQIGLLLEGLEKHGLSDKATIIIVSDHGMAEVSPDRTIYLNTLINADSYYWISRGSVMGLEPTAGQESLVEQALIKAHDHMDCYKKGNFPKGLHYGTHRRVSSITCVAHSGWLIGTDPTKGSGYTKGAHGFDPSDPNMTALFIAKGPNIVKNKTLGRFDNVDIYPLIMKHLGLIPEANDGSLETFTKGALKP
jgi:predicted AlkP superfamily pyrophosphatase or phosphodiesterase